MITALVDNTVLSNFAHVGKPLLLKAAFEQMATTHVVSNERETGERLGRIPVVEWNWLTVVELSAEETLEYERLLQQLDAGEASCLAIAKNRTWLVLTDDRDARRQAQEQNIAVSGTLGVLVRLVKLSLLTINEVDTLLTQMKEHGYRSPVNSIRELLNP